MSTVLVHHERTVSAYVGAALRTHCGVRRRPPFGGFTELEDCLSATSAARAFIKPCSLLACSLPDGFQAALLPPHPAAR
jgi:hypothetical protein